MAIMTNLKRRPNATCLKTALTALIIATALCFFIPTESYSVSDQNFFQRGMSAYQAGQLDQAIELFKQATAANAKNTDAYYNLGAIYYKQKRYPEALATFNKLLQITPQDYSARFHQASVLEKMGRPADALKSFQMIPKDSSRYESAQTHIKTLKTQVPTTAVKPTIINPTTPTTTTVTYPTVTTPVATGDAVEFATGFAGPTGIAQDNVGFLYVANYSKHCIDKVSANGQHTQLVCNSGIKGPVGLAVDRATGYIYVANHLDNSIARVSQDGQVTIISRKVGQPYYLYFDENQRILYVTEQKTNSIAKIRL